MCDLPETQTQEDPVDFVEATQIEVRAPWGRLNSCIGTMPSVDLFECSYTFGRDPANTIFVDKTHFQLILNISKQHFNLCKEDDLIFVRDLSKNGTFINNTKIGRNNRHIIHQGDFISVGHPSSKIYQFSSFMCEDSDYPDKVRDKYFISKKLGRGAFGEVRLAYHKQTFKQYAIKRICKSRSVSSMDEENQQKMKSIKTEIEILTTFSHTFIIQMLQVFENEKDVFLVLEYMPGGELTSRIVSSAPFPEKEVKFIFYQILLAIRFLHMNGVTHRDLKPENILLISDTAYPLIKVSDFGLSKILECTSLMETTCGTVSYAAPEILKSRESYNKKVDVWSLGVILFYMLSKTQPFTGDTKEEIAKNIITGSIKWTSKLWRYVSGSAKDLTRKMLVVDPINRLNIADVFSQEWIYKDKSVKARVEQLTEQAIEVESSDDEVPLPKRLRLARTM